MSTLRVDMQVARTEGMVAHSRHAARTACSSLQLTLAACLFGSLPTEQAVILTSNPVQFVHAHTDISALHGLRMYCSNTGAAETDSAT